MQAFCPHFCVCFLFPFFCHLRYDSIWVFSHQVGCGHFFSFIQPLHLSLPSGLQPTWPCGVDFQAPSCFAQPPPVSTTNPRGTFFFFAPSWGSNFFLLVRYLRHFPPRRRRRPVAITFAITGPWPTIKGWGRGGVLLL